MNLVTADIVKLIADSEQGFLDVVDPGKIYKHKLKDGLANFLYVPRYVYFYYLRIESNGKLNITKHDWVDGDINNKKTWKKIPPDKNKLESIIRSRATFARSAQGLETGFGHTWQHKSYIVIFVDESSWQLHKNGANKAPVIFNTSKGGKDNHTFFDAEDFDIDMPDPENPGHMMTCTAVSMINHMKKEGTEKDLTGADPKELFHFDLFFEVESSHGPSKMTVIIDPTGTNQGPPVDPQDPVPFPPPIDAAA